MWCGYFGLHALGGRFNRTHNAAKWFLVAASFVFYAIGSADFVLIFMASVAMNYVIGTAVSKWRGLDICRLGLGERHFRLYGKRDEAEGTFISHPDSTHFDTARRCAYAHFVRS